MKNFTTLIISSLLFTTVTFATTINVPSDYSTIQAGINAASNGDTVLVQPGTYVENINFNGENIVVGSLFLTTQDTYYISSTVIDAGGSGSVVRFDHYEDSTSVLHGFTLTNGHDWWGSGILCIESSPTLKNLIITGNSFTNGGPEGGGGGIFCYGSSPLITNVIITNNITDGHGGGIVLDSLSNAVLVNVLVHNNTSNTGGGLVVKDNSTPLLVNTSIISNSVDALGSGILILDNSYVVAINCILWNESGNEIIKENDCELIASYTLVQNGWEGEGNINTDPLFVDANNGNYRLSDYSPCIGAGIDSNFIPITDIEGNPRPNPPGSNPDMGAYENDRATPSENTPPSAPQNLTAIPGNQKVTLHWGPNTESDIYKYNIHRFSMPPTALIDSVFHPDSTYIDTGLTNGLTYHYNIIAVDSNGNESDFSHTVSVTPNPRTVTVQADGNGDYASIQLAINAIANGDTVLVYPGTYVENINFNGKNIVVGSLILTTGDTYYISRTIIDGDSSGSVVTFENGEDLTAVLSGFTITNGYARGWYGIWSGGGIYCNGSNPSLENLIVCWNNADVEGGGIYCYEASPNLMNVIVRGNSAIKGGGIGLYWDSNPLLNHVEISENMAIGEGTSYEGSGGGIYCAINSSPNLVNVIINNNSAFNGAGIFCRSFSNPNLENVTINGNIASNQGGGIYCKWNVISNLVNTIMWNNLPQEIYFDQYDNPNSITISYSDVQGGEIGIIVNNNGTVNWLEGNIDTNPLFCDPDSGSYYLAQNSPCVGSGQNSTNMGALDVGCEPILASQDQGFYPANFILHNNYPNPFNPITTLRYDLPERANVTVTIYDILGRKVRTLMQGMEEPGFKSAVWDGTADFGTPVSAGIYLYQIQAGDFIQTRKMVLLK